MQQEVQNSSNKNILVIGKTGQGKSYFLNMLLMEKKPKQGPFKVVDTSDSCTQACQIEANRIIKYGETERESINANLLDTPGLFDTKDDLKKEYQNEMEPESIKHMKNIETTVSNEVFQNQFNRVILIINAREKFDAHIKGMVEISKIMIGQTQKMCVVITGCQNLYDRESDDESDIMKTLSILQDDRTSRLADYDIEDVFFLPNNPLSFYKDKQDKPSKFYLDQWYKLYINLRKSLKTKIKTWETLSIDEQIQIAKYFNYKIGKTQQQIEEEIKLETRKSVQMEYDQLIQQQNQERELLLQQQELVNTRKIQEAQQQQQKVMQEMEQQNKQKEQLLKKQRDQLEKEKADLERQKNTYQQNFQAEQLAFFEEQARQSQQFQQRKFPPQDPTGQYQQYYNKKGECVSIDVQINRTNHDMINLKNSEFFNEKINIKGLSEESNTFLGHIHYVESLPSEFIQFVFQGPNKLESVDVTTNHLIYSANRKQFIQAKKITLCDNLLYTNCEGKQVDVKILKIQSIVKKGYYAPLTSRGYFFGNRILLSCYVSPSEFPIGQGIAHLSMKPLILYRQMVMKYDNKEQKEIQEYKAPYAMILQKLFANMN